MRVQAEWKRIFIPVEDLEDEDDDVSPDLEIAGRGYVVQEEFDFDDPVTDYDRACAADGDVALVSVGAGLGLVFACDGMKTHCWWHEQQCLASGGVFPEAAQLDALDWKPVLAWNSVDTDFVLMNSGSHGAEPGDDKFDVRLPAGEYSIQRAEYLSPPDATPDSQYCGLVYRFVRQRFL